jgi:hypothetical protein
VRYFINYPLWLATNDGGYIMSVVDIAAPPFLQDGAPALSEFKITSKAAAGLIRGLMRRVIWHRFTAAVLMLAALGAIGGGIALIFYAGELAKQQRSADVTTLIEHENALNGQREQISAEGKDRLKRLDDLEIMLRFKRESMQEVEAKLADAKTPDAERPNIQKELVAAKEEIESLRQRIGTREADRDRIMQATKQSLAPIETSIRELNEQIAGSSTVLEYNSILIRVAAVLLIVFLVQTFITVFRYMTRLAAYYQARVDALQLAGEQDLAIADLQKLTSVLSPEAYDFGKVPRTPAEQAIDLARAIITSQKKAD